MDYRSKSVEMQNGRKEHALAAKFFFFQAVRWKSNPCQARKKVLKRLDKKLKSSARSGEAVEEPLTPLSVYNLSFSVFHS